MPANIEIDEKDINTQVGKIASEVWDQMMPDTDEMPLETQHLDIPGVEKVGDDKKDLGDTQGDPSLQTKTDKQGEKPTEEASDPNKVLETPSEAPQHWPEADKAMFKEQPKPVQDYLLRRHREMEADYTRKTQAVADNVRLSESVTRRIDPAVAQDMKAKGVSNEQFLTSLVDWHKLSMNDPVAFARQVVQNLKLDPKVVFEGQAPNPLEARLAAIETNLTAENQVRMRTIQENAANTLKDFAEEKDATGQVLRPHLDKVKIMMGRLMMADSSLELKDAYELAVYRDPELRASLKTPGTATKQPTAAQSTPDTQRQKEAQKAAKAAAANIRGTGHGTQVKNTDPQKPMSLRATMLAAADEVGLN